MVAIQFTNRFFGFQPKVRECGQLFQNLRPELLCVFAARVEVPCKLVEVAAYLAALGRQGGNRSQCVFAALRYYYGVFDIHTVQDAAGFAIEGIMVCRARQDGFANFIVIKR